LIIHSFNESPLFCFQMHAGQFENVAKMSRLALSVGDKGPVKETAPIPEKETDRIPVKLRDVYYIPENKGPLDTQSDHNETKFLTDDSLSPGKQERIFYKVSLFIHCSYIYFLYVTSTYLHNVFQYSFFKKLKNKM